MVNGESVKSVKISHDFGILLEQPRGYSPAPNLTTPYSPDKHPPRTRVEQIRQLGPTSSQLQYTPSLQYEPSLGSGLDRPWCPD